MTTPGNEDTPRTYPYMPGPARRALLTRSWLAAVGEATDQTWPELMAAAIGHAAKMLPAPGTLEYVAGGAPAGAEYIDWLAGALGIPPDEVPHELDELIPGLPDPGGELPDTPGHGRAGDPAAGVSWGRRVTP